MSSIINTRFTKVEVRIGVTVNYFQLPATHDLERLAADLNAEFDKFDGFAECKSAQDVVRQAIEVNATFGKLLDLIQLPLFPTEYAYSQEVLKAMQTGAAIITRYECEDVQSIGLGYVARDRLSKRITDFYRNSQAPRAITANWLWDLKFYDYLIANDLLDGQRAAGRWGGRQPMFSREEHHEFLHRHTKAIHLRMAETATNGRYWVPDPLQEPTVQTYFKVYKLQRSIIKDLDLAPEQSRLS